MDLESRRPMSTDAVFRIMSVTKPVVAVAIRMLVEDGKVQLTDPVAKFIPELKTLAVAAPAAASAGAKAEQAAAVPAGREITLRDLLTHTSGLKHRRHAAQSHPPRVR
jgi:CubicO group peptidase (beta-lactamase class C family)